MPSNWRTFAGTPQSAALMQPWIAPAQPLDKGSPLGYDSRTWGTWRFDPVLTKSETGHPHSLILHFIGDKGGGKSALMKALTLDFLTMQMGVEDGEPVAARAWISDRQTENGEPEYKKLTDLLHAPTLSLARKACFNIFDAGMNLSEWDRLDIAVNVAETGKEAPLTGWQPLAVQIATDIMTREYGPLSRSEVFESIVRTLNMNDVDEYFNRSNSVILSEAETKFPQHADMVKSLQLRLNRPHNVVAHDFLSDAGLVGTYYNRIHRGDFGRSIGGTSSIREILTSGLVHLDWTGVQENLQSLLESMLWKFQAVASINGDTDMLPHVKTGEEMGLAMKNLMHARFESAYSKEARKRRMIDLRAYQYEIDLTEAGEEGSELRSLGRNIDLGVGARFYCKQPLDMDVRRRLLARGISNPDIDILMSELPPGTFGFKLPTKPLSFFHHELPESLKKIVDTESANAYMSNRMSVAEVPAFQERARRYQELKAKGVPWLVE